MREIRKLFPYCSQKKIGKKPCFYSKIALCNPCPNQIEKITDIRLKERLKNNYRKNIIQIIRVLNGDVNLVLRDLYRKLKKLSRQKDSYEEALVLRNQINRFESSIHNSLSDYEKKPSDPKYAIKQLLHLLNPFFPNFQKLRRIECYDISDLSKEFTAASMVVMTDGIIDKSEYKRFKIKNLQAKSDFEMLEEVLRRRFNNQFPKPDLIVVDGGKPQVRTVYKILIDLSNSIPVIGIAKHPDRLIVGTNIFPMIRPSLHNEGFNLVRIIRDESHRFAKKYHLHLRNVKLNPTLNKLL
jgi:excinuclease UvrABC nuclease subunit